MLHELIVAKESLDLVVYVVEKKGFDSPYGEPAATSLKTSFQELAALQSAVGALYLGLSKVNAAL